MIKVAVLGSTGMLGHVVAEQLELDARFSVRRFCRNPQNGETYIDALSNDELIELRGIDYVINCIGLIKQLQQTTHIPRRNWFVVNSIFPWNLAEQCKRYECKLIQISTDCVYAGLEGNYTESCRHDAEDDYGLSKSLGEPHNAMILRTSVIGHEKRGKLSLLEWAISKRGQMIDGYTNHTWNGLTAIEYANVCKKIMLQNLFRRGRHHVFSDSVTKYELLSMVNDVYKLDLNIQKTEARTACYRTLQTTHSLNATLDIPSLKEMLHVMSNTPL